MRTRVRRNHKRFRGKRGRPNPGRDILPPEVASSLIDIALGQGFVQFLKAIGIRDKILEVVMPDQQKEV